MLHCEQRSKSQCILTSYFLSHQCASQLGCLWFQLIVGFRSFLWFSFQLSRYVLLIGDRSYVKVQANYTSMFKVTACILSINIPLGKLRHMVEPLISRTRKYLASTLMGCTRVYNCEACTILTRRKCKVGNDHPIHQ